MIKILHIARPLSGVGIYIKLLCKNIDNEQFSNVLVCNLNEEIIIPQNKNGLEIPLHHINIFREVTIFKDIKLIFKLIQIVKKENPDIIHCHSAKPGIVGRIVGLILRKKTFYTPHAYSYLSSDSKFNKRLFFFLEKVFGLTNTYTLACSNSEYLRAINDLKISKNKVLVWNNSIEKNILFNEEPIVKISNKYICTIGRPSYQKNTELLLDAIKKVKESIPDIQLIILGVGHYSPSLNYVVNFIKKNELKNNIKLIPWLDRSDALTILKNCHLYISTSRYEGLPYSVIEALSLSKPCVLTNVDGHKDLVKDGFNGYLTTNNFLDISNKIITIYNDSDLQKNMGINSKKMFENYYSIENNIKELENIYLQTN
jgi:glycosyltransferase involved in cell wall biosynthesis